MNPTVCRLLLTDDETAFLESTAQLLRNDGYQCDTASDACQASEILSSANYDLLITDIKMPGNRDLEFVERAHQAAPGMPVIIVTGYPSAQTAISSIHLPVVAYLRKPLAYDELRTHVERCLAQSDGFRVLSRVIGQIRASADELVEIQRSRWLPERRSAAAELKVPALVLRTLAGCVAELVALEVSGSPRARLARTCEILECPRWPVHRRVIREAVDLLRETRRRFKSKELEQVRKMLKDLLEESD